MRTLFHYGSFRFDNIKPGTISPMLAAPTIADEILDLKRQRKAILLAHHYQEPEIQELADVVGLRTLMPLDRETICASVRKTSKALLLHEDTRSSGISVRR